MIRNLLHFAPLFMLFRSADKGDILPVTRERQPAPIAEGDGDRALEAAKQTIRDQEEKQLRAQMAETDSAVTSPEHMGKAPAAQPPSSVVQNPESQAAAAFKVSTAVAGGDLKPTDGGKFELPPNANGPAVASDLTVGGTGGGAGVSTDTGIQTGGPVVDVLKPAEGAAGGDTGDTKTGKPAATGGQEAKPEKASDLEDANTREQLVSLAEKEGVTIGSHDTKGDIAKAIVAKRKGGE